MASKILLEPGKYYHIYNHAIGNEDLFRSDADYICFMNKFVKYITPIVSTIAYCFMPNHFHCCVRIYEMEEIKHISSKYMTNETIQTGIYRSFSHFFNSYAQNFNKKYVRVGGLFISNFKRKEILSDDDLKRLICYIHNNPVESNFVSTMEQWPYSSYSPILSGIQTNIIPISMNEILRLFEDIDNFIYVHRHP